MTPRQYRICQSPVLGLLMWASGQCVFPPLFDDVAIDLTQPGAVASQEVEVQVPLDYQLHLRTRFSSDEARVADKVIGGYVDGHCGTTRRLPAPEGVRVRMGTPIRFQVRVVALPSQDVVLDESFESLCSIGHAGDSKWRDVAVLPLEAGRYRVTVGAPEGQPTLAGTRNFLSLNAPRNK